jgi:hypothetical protein
MNEVLSKLQRDPVRVGWPSGRTVAMFRTYPVPHVKAAMPDAPPSPASGPLQVSLSIEGRDGDRWRGRVLIQPCGCPVDIDGATLSMVDGDGAPAGPVVVLPVEGLLSEAVALQASVRGPERLPPGATLRLTVFMGGTSLVWDEPVTRREGFQDYLAGRTQLTPGPLPEGRNLTSEEIERLAGVFPWLAQSAAPSDAGKAFDAFREDLLASLDLDTQEPDTADLLRMLRET